MNLLGNVNKFIHFRRSAFSSWNIMNGFYCRLVGSPTEHIITCKRLQWDSPQLYFELSNTYPGFVFVASLAPADRRWLAYSIIISHTPGWWSLDYLANLISWPVLKSSSDISQNQLELKAGEVSYYLFSVKNHITNS